VIDNNNKNSYCWLDSCVQSSSLAQDPTDLTCAQAPSYVDEAYNEENYMYVSGSANRTNMPVGGYTVNGEFDDTSNLQYLITYDT
jgi:hypothetical protein